VCLGAGKRRHFERWFSWFRSFARISKISQKDSKTERTDGDFKSELNVRVGI
jgi:hypothetical protein